MSNHLLDAALSYASMGWAVFPCKPNGKRPLTSNGLHDATTDAQKIKDWWAIHPKANIGINCGASNLAVIDLDVKNGIDGPGNWSAWCSSHDVNPNGTTSSTTPSGGKHLIYYGKCRSTTSKIAPNVDSRGDGGYIVAPPSTIDGLSYLWDSDSGEHPHDLPAAVALALGEVRDKPEKTPVTRSAASAGSLAELIGSDGHALSRKGTLEEWCGPCPWCGGHDRFVVGWDGEGRDGAGRYYCRKCEQKGDSVTWLIERKGLHPVAAKDARGVEVKPEYRKVAATIGGGCDIPIDDQSQCATAPASGNGIGEEETCCLWLRTFERIEFPMMLDNLLPAGIVGGINAEGGTGKTYLMIAMFVAIATGIEWGPFKPTRPHKVLLLLGEDPTDVVRNRIHDIVRQIVPRSYLDLLALNFHAASVRGVCGPLMQLSGGNPAPSQWADWLDATITSHKGLELIGIDPLRKFYGLDENKNEHAHAFIGHLESVTLKHSLTALYNHHISKAIRELAVGQITGRGASGLSDNCRWIAAMRTVDEKQAEYLELEGNPSDYVEFAVTKSNYAPKLPRPAYFRREEHGVLVPSEVSENRLSAQVEYLAELVDGLRLSVRDLVKEARAADVRSAMKERFSGFRKDDFHRIVEHGKKAGILAVVPMPFGRGGRMTEAIVRAGAANE